MKTLKSQGLILLTLSVWLLPPSYVTAQYTLTDNDVEVVDGMIQSCSYDFAITEIIIPELLDGQTVVGVADGYYDENRQPEGVFSSKGITIIRFPSSMKYIGAHAFYHNEIGFLDFSSCPELESLGTGAFRNNRIRQVDLDGCNRLATIEDHALEDNLLTQLILDDCPELTIIGRSALNDNQLSSLNLSACTKLEYIREGAFFSNPMEELDLGGCSSLLSIGNFAFNGNLLESIDLAPCTALIHIGHEAFGDNKFEKFILPENGTYVSLGWVDQDGVAYPPGSSVKAEEASYHVPLTYTLQDEDVEMKDGMILSCAYRGPLRSIIIPASLKGQIVIGLAGNTENGKEIRGVFESMQLIRVEWPATLEVIGDFAFFNNHLQEIDLSKCRDLRIIGNHAFSGNLLETLDFEGCTKLEKISESAFNMNRLRGLDLRPCISLVHIGDRAFSSQIPGMQWIDLTECSALEYVGFQAFYHNTFSELNLQGCTHLKYIGKAAFAGTNQFDFQLPEHSEYPSHGWRDGSGSVYMGGDWVPNWWEYYYVPEGYSLTDNDVVVVNGIIQSCSYDFAIKDIIIPETLDGQKVIGIAGKNGTGGVFRGRAITRVSFPPTMEFIGRDAFADNALSMLDFSNCPSLYLIGRHAFRYNELTSVDFSACRSLGSIRSFAFASNKLAKIDLGPCKALTYLEGSAFSKNELKGFDLPINEQYVQNNWHCSELRVHTGGSRVENLNLFYYVPGIYILNDEDVVVRDGIIESCSYNFHMKEIEIPPVLDGQAVRGIAEYPLGESIFADKDLVHVGLPGSLESVCKYAFAHNSLLSLDLSSSPDLRIIGAHSFRYNCMRWIVFEDLPSLNRIGGAAFRNNPVERIRFEECDALKDIEAKAFFRNFLSMIDLSPCSGLAKIGAEAFASRTLKSFTLPEHFLLGSYGWENDEKKWFRSGTVVRDLETGYTAIGYYNLPKLLARANLTGDEIDNIVMGSGEGQATWLELYPNPADDYLYIRTDRDAHLRLLNLSGAGLLEQELFAGSTSIALDHLQAGIYLVEIRTDQGKTVLKLVIR